MIRQIAVIDKERCTGCGLCVTACHEGAIGLVDGKAVILRDDFCDGMGDCLPACPADAISFEERDTLAYDEAAVQAAKGAGAPAGKDAPAGAAPAGKDAPVWGTAPAKPAAPAWTAVGFPATDPSPAVFGSCPGSAPAMMAPIAAAPAPAPTTGADMPSQLAQWPCQIKLVPVNAPFFAGARLLVAADCTAFAYADFHARFMAGRVTLVGCPKLDSVDYSEKLGAILAENDISDVVLARMDVPCCGGLQNALARALAACGKQIPAQVVTIGRNGRVLAQAPLMY